MFNSDIDFDLLRKRKEMLNEAKSSVIEIDIDTEIYKSLSSIAVENNVSVDDIIIYILQNKIIDSIKKPKEIDETIDSAYLSLYLEDLIATKKSYLIVDIVDLESKFVLLPSEKYEELKI